MTKDMTKGNTFKHLIEFAIPLILGNLFQLTYNAVDAIVVGQFAGDDALAAVGCADPIMNLLILGITGLCIGASVLMSNFFGAGKYEQLKREVGTTISLGIVLVTVVFVVGMVMAKDMLILLKVPKSILPMATTYLRIIFLGMPFTCLYNIYSAALRSVGDAKTPTRFLAMAAVLNGCMDVLFVGGLKMGVFGAALSTVIAEGVSAILCIVYVYRHVPVLHLEKNHLAIDKKLIKQTVQYGGITALQQCSQPIGKLFIQGVINTLGVSTIAAFNAVGKIEDFALVPGRSIGNALTTYTAQNHGAGQKERIKEGFQKTMVIDVLYWLFIGSVLLLVNEYALSLFTKDASTQLEGVRYITIMCFFYWLPGITNALQGFFRGVGKVKTTLFGTLTQIGFRVLFTFILVPKFGIIGVAIACIIGWGMMTLWQIPYQKYFIKTTIGGRV